MGGTIGAFRPQLSHSSALDMLVSKGKIVQSSGATALPASWCIFLGEGASMCKRALDTRHLLRRSFCAERVRIRPAGNRSQRSLRDQWQRFGVVRRLACDRYAKLQGGRSRGREGRRGSGRRNSLPLPGPHANQQTPGIRRIAMHTHEQCRAGGYVNIKTRKRIDLPPIRPGQTHTLHAELHGNSLTVTADGNVAWYGSLGNEPLSLQGPTGFRTDSARFEFQYYAGRSTTARTRHGAPGPEHCVMSEGD
jgi:hypothetical protein